jgi:hypothetical protein
MALCHQSELSDEQCPNSLPAECSSKAAEFVRSDFDQKQSDSTHEQVRSVPVQNKKSAVVDTETVEREMASFWKSFFL